MSPFSLSMAIGLGGLVVLALPGFRRHGSHGHAGSVGKLRGPSKLSAGQPIHVGRTNAAHGGSGRLGQNSVIPEPRVVLSLLAFFGAFGNVAQAELALPLWKAALVALVPAFLVEAFITRPIWNWALSFSGRPSTPLAALVEDEARAVTSFRNGRGIVSVERDGRAVQLAAQLPEDQRELMVKVGDKLRVKDVDVEKEWVLVSIR